MYRNLQNIKTKISMLIKKISWLVVYGAYFKYKLDKNYDIENVKIFKFSDWHLGCNYFIGYSKKNGEKVFIKTGGKYKLAKRESDIINYLIKMDNKAEKYIPRIIAADNDSVVSFIAIEYIEGVTLKKHFEENEVNSVGLIEEVIKDLNTLLDILHKNNVIHRDIRPDNVMVKNGATHLVLIDFAFAISTEIDTLGETDLVLKNPDILNTLGEEYKPRKFYWDDAYSINMLVEEIVPSYSKIYPTIYNEINSKIGKLTYEHKRSYL
ncbi:protein kinase domain-containing protein [Jeotgalibaca dankookensis]|uniref:protein kinase domain-containing protein n=1 Tax=Jeotgalibaca dankookensis TaxID=708126 RepID=UPI0007850C70|nr:protein kinase [Jeotgalibaca dankookensis]